MGVPRTYRKSQERLLANYNWTDLIQGQGIVNYYLFRGTTDAAEFYGASSDNYKRSTSIEVLWTAGSGSATKGDNYDAGQFNQGMVLEGTAYAEGSFSVIKTSGSGTSGNISIIVKLIKVSATNTDLVSEQSQSISTASGLTTGNFLVDLEIPKTTFKDGDVLRIEMTINKDGGAGGVWEMSYGTDPTNRDGTRLIPSTADVTTTTKISIPFKLII